MYALARNLGCSKYRLARSLDFLLTRCLIPLLPLFLVREGRQATCGLPNLDVSQRLRKLAHEMLDKDGIQGLGLMSLDNVLNDAVREIDEVLLRPWLRGNQGVQLLGRGAWGLARSHILQSTKGGDAPPRAAAPIRSAALLKSACSSRSRSRRCFSRGSSTASSS